MFSISSYTSMNTVCSLCCCQKSSRCTACGSSQAHRGCSILPSTRSSTRLCHMGDASTLSMLVGTCPLLHCRPWALSNVSVSAWAESCSRREGKASCTPAVFSRSNTCCACALGWATISMWLAAAFFTVFVVLLIVILGCCATGVDAVAGAAACSAGMGCKPVWGRGCVMPA